MLILIIQKIKKAIIIGSGFSGLSSAAFLAKSGIDVTVIEKNNQIGGRARILKTKGYTFDMGPSWYWLPDIFEDFFKEFNLKINDLFELIQLDPGFKIIFQQDELKVNSNFEMTCKMFDKYEKNGGKKLKLFIKDAALKYNIGVDFINKAPGISIFELFNKKILFNLHRFELFTSYKKQIRKYFQHPYLINLLEFPVLFLGASAEKIPALYSLMTYSAIKQGTFYPLGGFNQIVQALIKLCKNLGVKFITNEAVKKINIDNAKVNYVVTEKEKIIKTDYVIASSDYTHVEKELIQKKYRNYSDNYWNKKTFAPSCLIFYLGINKKIKKLVHHNLFFNENIQQHTKEIYEYKKWPEKPLFYVCCPSKTDVNVAPEKKENLFILMPIAIGLKDTKELREKYFKLIISKIEKYCKQNIKDHIEVKKSYCIKEFQKDYNAYKGNAYGLANILSQTANLKPKIINKKVSNLFYTGQLTVPGPGVPPSLISGKLVAEYIIKNKQ